MRLQVVSPGVVMTWQGKRRAQLPRDWAQRRQARLELDGFRCTAYTEFPSTEQVRVARCDQRATDVHHAVDRDDHRIQSLRSLCAEHHKLETQREAQQAQGRGVARLRPRSKHPGMK
jgi:hypothetical protein